MADWTPQSRVEEILFATINGEPYDGLPQSRIEELLLELKAAIESGGGGGGTTNYNLLSNLPSVNDIVLKGNKTAADLNLVLAEVGKGLSTNDYSNEEKDKVTNLITSIQSILDGSDIDSFGDVEVALLDKADVSDLGTASAKNSTNSVTAGSTDLVESGAVKDAIDAAVSRAYHHAGTKTVAQLTHDLLIAANEGNVYEITDSGTTTSDFMEGIGKPIKEGDNVGIARVSEGVYKFDLLSGFVDTTNFVQKSQTAGLLKNDGTVNDEIEGDVATLKSGFTNLDNEVNGDATVYPYADVITIEDAVPSNLADCSVKIEPVQDLHGYDNPWVGGAGKNKLPLVLADIKSINTEGSWSGNTYTYNDIVYTLVTDNDGNIVKITVNGTTTSRSFLTVGSMSGLIGQEVIMNGGASGGVASYTARGYCLFTGGVGVPQKYDIGSGATFTVSSYGGDVQINVNNTSVTNLDFYPMIRLATETDATFAPYTNICPISGHTEVDVQRDGKNLLEDIEEGGVDDYGEENLSFQRCRSNDYIKVCPNKQYTFFADTNQSKTLQYIIRSFKDNNNSYKLSDSTWQTGSYTFTTDSDCHYIKIIFGFSDNSNISKSYITNAQLELGSTATPYEPYQGKTYTIALGDTIYGGTVDFDSGVMTVDRAIVDLGSLTWEKDSSASHSRFVASYSGIKKNGNVISDIFQTGNYYDVYDHNKDNVIAAAITYSQIVVHSTGYESDYDTTQFKTAMDGHYACYELATPFTVQLTPQQIQLLKGQNTLTASTGQISVTVNGVSGAIGQIQTQANATDAAVAELAKQLPDAPTTDGAYVLTVTVADGVPTYSWESTT